jgi:branched-chain amino acid transport system permease protein
MADTELPGWSPWLTLWVGLALTCRQRVDRVGMITLRMSGHYLPLATIAWGLVAVLSDGQPGCIGKIRRSVGLARACRLAALILGKDAPSFVLTWAILLAGCVVHSSQSAGFAFGSRHSVAEKGASQMAEAMGINTFRYKVTAFSSSPHCWLRSAGWLLAHFPAHGQPFSFWSEDGH